MVTLLCLLKHYKVLVKHFLLREGNTIKSLQLSLCCVTAPESTGDACQFNGFDDASADDMRSLTEVCEATLCICGDRTILKILLDVFYLVCLSSGSKLFYSVGLADLLAYHSLVLTSEFKHFILYLLEVALLDHLTVRQQYIIEETSFNGRTESELYSRI